MNSTDDIYPAEPDIAQLLVNEAGRTLEDLTPELVMALPDDLTRRRRALDRWRDQMTTVGTLIEAAGRINHGRSP